MIMSSSFDGCHRHYLLRHRSLRDWKTMNAEETVKLAAERREATDAARFRQEHLLKARLVAHIAEHGQRILPLLSEQHWTGGYLRSFFVWKPPFFVKEMAMLDLGSAPFTTEIPINAKRVLTYDHTQKVIIRSDGEVFIMTGCIRSANEIFFLPGHGKHTRVSTDMYVEQLQIIKQLLVRWPARLPG
jgi:hypothetical protein